MGETAAPDTAITIKGLTPGSFCSVRVVASNSANFQATSDAIYINTPHASSHSHNDQNGFPAASKAETVRQPQSSAKPSVLPYKDMRDGIAFSSVNQPAASTLIPGQHQQQRRDSARRISPSLRIDQEERRLSDQSPIVQDSVATVQDLTNKLGALRREIDEIDLQDRAEEEQYQIDRDTLSERRDLLRNQLREKDDESKDLNKNVAVLQRQSTAAQNQKKTHEKLLQSRRSERQRMQDDIQRWQEQTVEMEQETKTMNQQKDEVEQKISERVLAIVNARSDDQQAVKQLEELIRDTGKHVKELEEDQKTVPGETQIAAPAEWRRKASEQDHEWSEKLKELQARQHKAYMECFHAQTHLQSLQLRFEEMSSQRRQSQAAFYPLTLAGETVALGPDALHESPKIGSRFQGGFTGNAIPAMSNAEARLSRAPSLLSRNGPTFNTIDPETASLFRTANAQPASRLPGSSSSAEMERLTGGAMTSPSAGGLLPSGLLGDEADESMQHRLVNASMLSDPDAAIPSAIEEPIKPLPGLGTVSAANSTQAVNQLGPVSPSLRDSRSPSLTSSLHESVAGIHHHQHKLSKGTVDSDRRSLASTGSKSQAPKRSRMFSEIFGNRQRGKSATIDDGPALGTLRSSQSQSMPRQYDAQGSESDAPATEPRRGPSGGFLGSMSNAMLGSKTGASSGFASRVNPWARSGIEPGPSSRPSSVYSAENMLPGPSTDSQPFGWNDGLGRSNTTRTGRHMTSSWSGIPSRRQSIKVDSPSSQLEDISQLDEDAQLLPAPAPSTPQPPIGTKSRTKKSAAPTQLNPNARDFRSMFIRDKRAEREKEREKDRSQPSAKSKKKESRDSVSNLAKSSSSIDDQSRPPSTPKIITTPSNDDSPNSPHTRQAQQDREETRSPSTADVDDAERRSTRTSSSAGPSTPLDSGTATPNRESFMKKITRKGSSGKFSLPGLKTRGMTKEKPPLSATTTGTGDETDEDATTPSGRGYGSVSGSPLIGSWRDDAPGDREKDKDKERDSNSKDGSNTSSGGKRSSGAFSLSSFKRRAKKGREKDPPSISETSASLTSDAAGEGTGDEGEGVGKASTEE